MVFNKLDSSDCISRSWASCRLDRDQCARKNILNIINYGKKEKNQKRE